MHGLYLKRTQLQCVICTVCEPTLVCHDPQLPCDRSLGSSLFLGFPSRRRCALAVALHRRDSGLGTSHARRVLMKYLNTLIYNLRYIAANIHTRFSLLSRRLMPSHVMCVGVKVMRPIHTHNFRQCSHASVGRAQARPNHTTRNGV